MRAAAPALLCLLTGLGCNQQLNPGATGVDPEPTASPASVPSEDDPALEPGPEPEGEPVDEEAPSEERVVEADPIADAPPPVEGETPSEAVERCRLTDAFDACLIRALDDRDVRARERELLIEAHRSLGREERAREHMRIFLEQYPRDRRGNRYRMILYDGEQP